MSIGGGSFQHGKRVLCHAEWSAAVSAASALAVMRRVAEDTPRQISEIIPEAPAALCDLIARLHAKSPEQRFQTAQEVAGLLSEFLTEFRTHLSLARGFLNATASRVAGRPIRLWKVVAAIWLCLFLAFSLCEMFGATNLVGLRKHRPDAQGIVAGPADDFPPNPGRWQAPDGENEVVSLFNGKDLNGWQTFSGDCRLERPRPTVDWKNRTYQSSALPSSPTSICEWNSR